MDVDVKKRNGPLRARAGAGRVVSACHWSLLSSVRTRKITSSAVQDKSGARWNYTIGRSGREQRAVAAHWTIRSRRQTGRARARGRAGDRLAPSTAERPSRLRTPDLHTHQEGNLRLRAPRTDAAPQASGSCSLRGGEGVVPRKRRLFVVTSTEHRNRQGAASVAVAVVVVG